MAMSIQRVFILTIALNLLLGVVTGMYNATTYNTQSWAAEQSELMEQTALFKDNFGTDIPDSNNYISAQSFGNPKEGGISLWEVLKGGVSAIPTKNPDNWLEGIMILGINWFRGLLAMILIIEAYLIFVNKKTS